MKSQEALPLTPEIQSRLAGLRERAVEMGAQAGLHEVEDKFAEVVEPQIRAAAWEVHGPLAVAPEVLQAREAVLRQRGDEAARRAAAFFEAVGAASLSGAPARPMFGWRGSLIVVMAAALAGLLWPAAGLRGCAALALSAAIAVLALPLLPFAALFVLRAGRAVGACGRDLIAAALAYRACRKLRRSAWAAEDHRSRVEKWVREQMTHLVAEYEYQKSLAASARLAL
jgi:hypothetical protein